MSRNQTSFLISLRLKIVQLELLLTVVQTCHCIDKRHIFILCGLYPKCLIQNFESILSLLMTTHITNSNTNKEQQRWMETNIVQKSRCTQRLLFCGQNNINQRKKTRPFSRLYFLRSAEKWFLA